MTLWQKNGGAPQDLPFQDAEADGTAWTSLADNPGGRAACGWTQAPAQPAFDPATQRCVWVAGAWAVESLPPPPPPPRPDLPKSTVTERLIALGKVGAVMSVLRADDALYALWFAPDWQTVYKDDERVLPILQAAGLTAEEIAQVMA